MAPRGKAAAAAAEPEVDEADVEEERDYSVYAEKELTPKMLDFAEWVGENVGDITEMEPERLIALGPTLYHEYLTALKKSCTDRLKKSQNLLKPRIPQLVAALKSRDATTRRKAANTLGLAGPDARAAVPALIEALKDSDAQVRLCP